MSLLLSDPWKVRRWSSNHPESACSKAMAMQEQTDKDHKCTCWWWGAHECQVGSIGSVKFLTLWTFPPSMMGKKSVRGTLFFPILLQWGKRVWGSLFLPICKVGKKSVGVHCFQRKWEHALTSFLHTVSGTTSYSIRYYCKLPSLMIRTVQNRKTIL